jgi:hypothetical protein
LSHKSKGGDGETDERHGAGGGDDHGREECRSAATWFHNVFNELEAGRSVSVLTAGANVRYRTAAEKAKEQASGLLFR